MSGSAGPAAPPRGSEQWTLSRRGPGARSGRTGEQPLQAQGHLQLGAALAPLREDGVLVVGSGNVVHNLGGVSRAMPDAGFDWAQRFDEAARELMLDDPAAIARVVALLKQHPSYAESWGPKLDDLPAVPEHRGAVGVGVAPVGVPNRDPGGVHSLQRGGAGQPAGQSVAVERLGELAQLPAYRKATETPESV